MFKMLKNKARTQIVPPRGTSNKKITAIRNKLYNQNEPLFLEEE